MLLGPQDLSLQNYLIETRKQRQPLGLLEQLDNAALVAVA